MFSHKRADIRPLPFDGCGSIKSEVKIVRKIYIFFITTRDGPITDEPMI